MAAMNEEELMEAITDAADLCPPIVNCELDNRRAKDIQKLINQQVLSVLAEVKPLATKLEREFQAVACDCGEPYKDTDTYDVLRELTSAIEEIEMRYRS